MLSTCKKRHLHNAFALLQVSCALQFWDNCLGNFQTYSEFSLSETNVSHLNLPTIGDKKRCAVSSTWRVVLYYDDEDSEYQKVDQEVIVTPKSLVSVIKVDSYFNSSLIQRFQVKLLLLSFVSQRYE